MIDIANQRKGAGIMTMKRAITGFLSGMFLLCMVSQAQADPVVYSFNSALTDGGTISGTLTIDTMTGTFPNVLVGANLVTTDSSITGDTYDNTSVAGAVVNTEFLALITGINNGNSLSIFYSPSPLVENGPGLSSASFVENNARAAGGVAAGAVSTPEPGTIFLFGSGLLGLGLWRYRRNLKS